MLKLVLKAEKILSATLVLVILALTSMQVVARYGMSQPFTWTEELSRFALISLTFLGSALVMGRNGHIVVDLNPESQTRMRKVMNYVSGSLMLAGCVFLAATALINAVAMGGVSSSATGFPIAILYYIMALGFLVMSLHAVIDLLKGPDVNKLAMRGI